MIKKFALVIALITGIASMNAQTMEELKKEQAAKKDSIAKIQGRVNALQAQMDALPGWRIGAFGTVGGSISGFDNWYAQAIPDNNSGTIGITFNAFANLIQEEYFWRNSLNVNLAWVKLDDKTIDTDDDSFRGTTDVFTLTSLFGYNLTKTLAVSTLGEYRTTLLDNFNDPGYLDLGVGVTWTPITNLIVVVHPLNYNFVFSDSGSTYESSLGAKVVADYTRKIGKVNFKTNLSAFLSYEDADYSNWTWTNSFSYTFWKGIGVGFDFGLRSNKQEAYNYALDQLALLTPPPTTVPTLGEFDDNELQTFWTVGMSYSF